MPRKATIFIPADEEVLKAIQDAHRAALAADEGRGWNSMMLRENGVLYSLERFSGKPCLSAGERQKWQRAIVRLVEQGQLVRYGNRIMTIVAHEAEEAAHAQA